MVDVVYDTYGVSATYTNRAAATSDVVVVLDRGLNRFGAVAQVSAGSVVLSVRKSEVLLMPLRGEEFYTVDSERYVVDSPVASNELEHRVAARLVT